MSGRVGISDTEGTCRLGSVTEGRTIVVGSATDTGSAADVDNAIDIGNAAEDGSATDTGKAAEVGSTTETGCAIDVGSAIETGNVAEVGSATDTGSTTADVTGSVGTASVADTPTDAPGSRLIVALITPAYEPVSIACRHVNEGTYKFRHRH